MRSAVLLALALAVSTPALAQPKLNVDRKDDAALLRDERKAIAEFQRRLRDQVSLKNGLLIIQDRGASGASLFIVPPTAFWSVDCSEAGIAVTFGAGSGDTDNGIALQLTGAAATQEQCVAMAPPIGQTLLAIIKGE